MLYMVYSGQNRGWHLQHCILTQFSKILEVLSSSAAVLNTIKSYLLISPNCRTVRSLWSFHWNYTLTHIHTNYANLGAAVVATLHRWLLAAVATQSCCCCCFWWRLRYLQHITVRVFFFYVLQILVQLFLQSAANQLCAARPTTLHARTIHTHTHERTNSFSISPNIFRACCACANATHWEVNYCRQQTHTHIHVHACVYVSSSNVYLCCHTHSHLRCFSLLWFNLILFRCWVTASFSHSARLSAALLLLML